VKRSTRATTQAAPGKTLPQSLKERLVVMIVGGVLVPSTFSGAFLLIRSRPRREIRSRHGSRRDRDPRWRLDAGLDPSQGNDPQGLVPSVLVFWIVWISVSGRVAAQRLGSSESRIVLRTVA
jgi:hypothetical protein